MIDIDLALIGIRAANAAYELNAIVRGRLLAEYGLIEDCYVTGANDARALICHTVDGAHKILAPQGTQFTKGEIPSIMENIKVSAVDIGNGREVSAGYWEQTQSLLSVLPSLDDIDLLGGHSMGGCIAHQIANTHPMASLKSLYSYGAPKCGNAAFWKSAKFIPNRLVRERDFAPVWPYFPDEWEQPNDEWWIHRCILTEIAHRQVMPDSVPDHDPSLYLDDITAIWGGQGLSAPQVAA